MMSNPELEESIAKLRQDVADMFTDVRLDAGLSRKDAIRRLDVVYSNLSRVESAGTDLRLSTIQRFAYGYGYKVEIALVPLGEEEDGPDESPTGLQTDE